MINNKIYILVLLLFLFTGCQPEQITDPVKVYTNWAGVKPAKDIEVINGYYWKSVQKVNSYATFLELKPQKHWRDEFLKQYGCSITAHYDIPSNAPAWFKPKSDSTIIWKSSYGAVCWEDRTTGHLFIHESVGADPE